MVNSEQLLSGKCGPTIVTDVDKYCFAVVNSLILFFFLNKIKYEFTLVMNVKNSTRHYRNSPLNNKLLLKFYIFEVTTI